MKHAAIPIELFNKIVEYLGTRPYNEVAGAIQEIRETAQMIDIDKENKNEE